MPNLQPELLRAGDFYFCGGLQARLVRVIRKTGLAATFFYSMAKCAMVFLGSQFGRCQLWALYLAGAK